MLYSPGLSPREQVKHVEGSEEPAKINQDRDVPILRALLDFSALEVMSKLTVLTIEATLQRQLVLGFIQGHDFGFGDGEGDFVLVPGHTRVGSSGSSGGVRGGGGDPGPPNWGHKTASTKTLIGLAVLERFIALTQMLPLCIL